MSRWRRGTGPSPRSARTGLRRLWSVRSSSTELAQLRDAFCAWLPESGVPAGVDPAGLWAAIDAAVTLAGKRVGLQDPRFWTPDQIGALAGLLADDPHTLAAVPPLLAFLDATGQWQGAPEEWEAAMHTAMSVAAPVATMLERLAEDAVDPAAEDAALRALPVVVQAEALLRFLSSGFVDPRRPVTGTGGLRRADVITAAGRIGVDLRGRTPRSMWDVPRLAAIWQVLTDAELLEVLGSHAGPTGTGFQWLSGDAAAGAKARRALAAGFLGHLIVDAVDSSALPDPLNTLLPVLVAAAADTPLPTADVLGDPAAPPATAEQAAARSVAHLLAEEGYLDVGQTVAAAPGLQGALAAVSAIIVRTGEE